MKHKKWYVLLVITTPFWIWFGNQSGLTSPWYWPLGVGFVLFILGWISLINDGYGWLQDRKDRRRLPSNVHIADDWKERQL